MVETLQRHGGPTTAVAARNGVGFGSPEALAIDVSAGEGSARFRVPTDLDGHTIEAGDELRYVYFPQQADAGDDLYAATAFALDLEFDDGSLLSESAGQKGGSTDQHGNALTVAAQYDAKTHYVDQWNARTVALASAAGRSIRSVIACVRRSPHTDLTAYLDDVSVAPASALPTRPIDWVSTTRGSQASGQFSRGNNVPLVAVPHGGVFGLPMTDASRNNWPYAYHEHNRGAENRPTIEAFATSHIPSPWIADRGVFQLMPSALAEPNTDRAARALAFSHDDELDGPHRYDVQLAGGIRAQLTASDFALALRCDFADADEGVDAGDGASMIVDHHGTVTDARLTLDGDTLVIEAELDDRADTPHHFLHVRIPRVVAHSIELRDGRLSGAATFDNSSQRRVDVLLGISTIGFDGARANLAAAGGFDDMLADAERRWEAKLATLEVEGASADQLRSVYSDLYRLFLYPNDHAETPGGAAPRYRSPFGAALDSPIRDEPAGEVADGVFSTNNGFWDTYRTSWPALNLLSPAEAGRLAQGFVQHYVDGGWTSRWSAPGAVDCMTGTTSDTVFADAIVKGVPGIDLQQAYDSALKNATVPARDPRVGRKGIRPGIFRGYIDVDTEEGMSWTLDNAINDWATAQLAATLAERTDGALQQRYRTEYEYFARRSLDYRAIFNPELGFFIGRTADGAWRVAADEYNPAQWDDDYTETNGWGTAFTVPHDGAGLAELHGGPAGLGKALDRFFATPETGLERYKGTDGHVIHEMTEARDVRMGMLGLSNQPAHHIPFMYMFAHRHDDAHRIVAEARSRLFVGSEIGQGYPGDEDNGEMSAWYVFSALGFYPLAPATGSYVLVPPLFTRSVIRPEGGAAITLTVTNPEERGTYIRRVLVNGEEWNDISVPHSVLAAGATIEFELSAEPCGWAGDTTPASASELHGFRDLLVDLTSPADADALFDDTGDTAVELQAGQSVEYRFDAPQSLGLYTVTSVAAGAFGWRCEVQLADGEWQRVDDRLEERFAWAGQTRPFALAEPAGASGADAGVQQVSAVRFTASAACVLSQLEFFAPDSGQPRDRSVR